MLSQHSRGVALIAGGMLAIGQGTLAGPDQGLRTGLKDLTKNTRFIEFAAPAGTQPATTHTMVEGYRAAILPNDRYVMPAGLEIQCRRTQALRSCFIRRRQDARNHQQRRFAFFRDLDHGSTE
jgi:hypothetical protein